MANNATGQPLVKGWPVNRTSPWQADARILAEHAAERDARERAEALAWENLRTAVMLICALGGRESALGNDPDVSVEIWRADIVDRVERWVGVR